MATQYYPRSRQSSESASRVRTLLGRYPNLNEQELAELINLFHYLRLLDVGLMTADDRLSEKLADFRRDHVKELERPFDRVVLAFALPVIVAIGLLWWVFA